MVEEKENVETLKYLRSVLHAWILETGDTTPKNPTPDRDDLDGNRLSNEFSKGERPGEATNAVEINSSGPIFKSDVDVKQ